MKILKFKLYKTFVKSYIKSHIISQLSTLSVTVGASVWSAGSRYQEAGVKRGAGLEIWAIYY